MHSGYQGVSNIFMVKVMIALASSRRQISLCWDCIKTKAANGCLCFKVIMNLLQTITGLYGDTETTISKRTLVVEDRIIGLHVGDIRTQEGIFRYVPGRCYS